MTARNGLRVAKACPVPPSSFLLLSPHSTTPSRLYGQLRQTLNHPSRDWVPYMAQSFATAIWLTTDTHMFPADSGFVRMARGYPRTGQPTRPRPIETAIKALKRNCNEGCQLSHTSTRQSQPEGYRRSRGSLILVPQAPQDVVQSLPESGAPVRSEGYSSGRSSVCRLI